MSHHTAKPGSIADVQLVKDAIAIAEGAVDSIAPKLRPPTQGTADDKMYYRAMWSLTQRAMQRFSVLARVSEQDEEFVEVSALIGRSILEMMLNAAYISTGDRHVRLQDFTKHAEYREYVYRRRMIKLGVPLRDEWFIAKETEFAQAKPKKWPSYECIAKAVGRETRCWNPPFRQQRGSMLRPILRSPQRATQTHTVSCYQPGGQ